MAERVMVQVCFSGLVLFVRTNGRIGHVLLRREQDHTPYFCWYRNSGSKIGDGSVVFEWWTDTERIAVTAGAVPSGSFRSIEQLSPPHLPSPAEEENFYWVPTMGELGFSNRVESDFLGPEPAGEILRVRVHLDGGTIRTGEFAFGQHKPRGPVKWIAPFRFVEVSSPAAPGPWDRAAAEKVVWDVLAPPGATRLRVVSTPFGRNSHSPQVTLLHEFVLADVANPLRLTLSNNPAPSVGPNEVDPRRAPGRLGLHFALLYDFLAEPPESGKRRVPKLPGFFSTDDSGGEPRRNVIEHREMGHGFQDCHLAKRSKPEDWVILGTAQRPICIPALADS